LKNLPVVWRDVQMVNDEALAAMIHDDRIDVLFDLAGHTHQNRLLMFSRRPAKVQISWTGYVGTTGLEAMDYLIADQYLIPEGDERYYRERVVRMPHGWLCYTPPSDAPDVVSLPCLTRGLVTFGCFNNSKKISSDTIAVWSEVLRRVPRSRLLLKFKWFDDPDTRQHFWTQFAAHGIEAARVNLKGWSRQADHLSYYGEVDLALDTYPYTGGITTCEALWMGVPVVTRVGTTFAARQSYSHLMNAGLDDLATWSAAEFVERAVSWATDPKRLVLCRLGLRSRVKQSPLCDGPLFARHLQDLIANTWRAVWSEA
jgi:predicted O-linked N-acetylglucosamine transferase (SPINDLY family)